MLGRADTLERRDFTLAHCADRHDAGADDLAAHDYSAGAALRHPATELRPMQTKLIIEHEQQGRLRIHGQRMFLAVYLKLNSRQAGLHLVGREESFDAIARAIPGWRSGLPASTAGAVDVSGGVARVIGGQLYIDARELGRLARPPQRIGLSEVNEMVLHGAAGDLKRRPDRPGCDSVNADALWTKLLGKRLHKVHCRRLGLRVIVQISRRVVVVDFLRSDEPRQVGFRSEE